MFGWFKKKNKQIKEVIKEAEEFAENKVETPKKEEKHIDCECRECIRRIKRAQYK